MEWLWKDMKVQISIIICIINHQYATQKHSSSWNGDPVTSVQDLPPAGGQNSQRKENIA